MAHRLFDIVILIRKLWLPAAHPYVGPVPPLLQTKPHYLILAFIVVGTSCRRQELNIAILNPNTWQLGPFVDTLHTLQHR